jgi:hypothetical protein
MRELLIAATTAIALTATAVTPAAAASIAGPYKSNSTCQDARKKYATIGYKVGPCDKTTKGYYFKFSK